MVRKRRSASQAAKQQGASADLFQAKVDQALSRFGEAVTPLIRARVGQPEASLTAAVQTLLREVATALGVKVLIHAEATDQSLGVRPDLAIDISGARTGVVELKAPGMGVPGMPGWGRARDRMQWEKLKALPNVLYTDGNSWAVYHYGQLHDGEPIHLVGDVRRDGDKLRVDDGRFTAAMQDFLLWVPSPPRDLRELIRISAGLCHLLREEVAEAIAQERRTAARAHFSEHLADWQEWLFPDLKENEFVDAYAQTVTFGLLLARREGVMFEGLEIPDIGEKLAKRHLLVGRALSILTARPDRGRSMEERSIVLQTMRRVIGIADWTDWPTSGTYHWLYEEFLEVYDPDIRRQTGSYYTPKPIADFMTRMVDDVLRTKLDLPNGLAENNVVVLDPAMGTGTFLQSIIDVVAQTVEADRGDVPASLRSLLARLIGFERQVGPFAVAELKLDHALDAHMAEAKDEDLRLYVADTLDDPNKAPLPARAQMYAPLAKSRREANKVKTDERVTVVIGNPPYRSRAKKYGKWVLSKNRGKVSLLDDFRSPGNGRHEYKLHDLAIYFWRWALWKAFESTPEQPAGVVAFLTTKAYLSGPSFAGMRRYLRERADLGWVVDLSPEGHQSQVSTRIFPTVPHAVCIGIFARRAHPRTETPALIRYTSISGRQGEKFSKLAGIDLNHAWQDCPSGWEDAMQPAPTDEWAQYPALEELLPFTSLGVTCNRAWVHAPTADVLARRWAELINADPKEMRTLLKETRDRTVDKSVSSSIDGRALTPLTSETAERPSISRIGFRSFDRQYLISDPRVVDFIRPSLWRIFGPGQVYLVTQLRQPITAGPAVVFSALVPDTDCFKGNHGGRVVPLWRDAENIRPNVSPGLVGLLSKRCNRRVDPREVMAYVAGVAAHSGYADRFREELTQPGVRVPLTADAELWSEAVEIGRRVVWLHTYGERFGRAGFRRDAEVRSCRPAVIAPIPGTESGMPESIEYDGRTRTLLVGSGRIGPVEPAVWAYEVSGMRVIKHWFDYRRRDPKGKPSSPLDDVRSRAWTVEMTEEFRDLIAVVDGCTRLESGQRDLLDRILAGPLVAREELELAGVLPAPAAARRPEDQTLRPSLFE